MIILTSFSRLKGPYDEAWAVVRSAKKLGQNTFRHVPALSPDWDLFRLYMDQKAKGQWNEQVFHEQYEPIFLRQMARDPQAQAMLDELCRLDREEKRIACACFCKDPATCHRSLLARLLAERGCRIIIS